MSLEQNFAKLPEACYTLSEVDHSLIMLRRGETGYYKTGYSTSNEGENRALADHLNAKLGVTKEQEKAMSMGSLFGWDIPAANPDFWSKISEKSEPAVSVYDEKAFSLNQGEHYLHIQTCESGFDYTIYNNDYSELDGGQLDAPDISINDAVATILEAFDLQDYSQEEIDPDILMEAIGKADQSQIAEFLNRTQPLADRIADAQQRAEHGGENGPAKETGRE